MTDGHILHISDTALMTAACRAWETEREDGFIRDPFAARLAGDRGRAILNALPRPEMMCFGVAVRSRFLDQLVLRCSGELGVRTVLSAGCGLDTRPWRLDLPADLNWIEADFTAVLDYKASLMATETPLCRHQSISVDLSDAAQRAAFLSAAAAAPALLITEGLLMYLPAETIDALATDAAAAGVRYWISDVTSPAFARAIGMDSYSSIQNMRAASHLDGLQILDLLNRTGWNTIQLRSYLRDIVELAGPRLAAAASAAGQNRTEPPPPIPPDDPTGVHLFELTRP